MQTRICQNSKSTIAMSVDLKSTMTISVDLKSTMTIRADIKSTKTISVIIKLFHTQHRSTTVFLYPILIDHGLFIIRRLNWGSVLTFLELRRSVIRQLKNGTLSRWDTNLLSKVPNGKSIPQCSTPRGRLAITFV